MDAKILIIASDPDVTEFQRHYLERRQYQVFATKNPDEALELTEKHSPHIVIYDIPYKSFEAGLSILPKLKLIKPDIVIYLITTFVDKKALEKALLLGAKEVLFKPVFNEDIEDKIKAALP